MAFRMFDKPHHRRPDWPVRRHGRTTGAPVVVLALLTIPARTFAGIPLEDTDVPDDDALTWRPCLSVMGDFRCTFGVG